MALNKLTLANANAIAGTSGSTAINGVTAGSSLLIISNPENAFRLDDNTLTWILRDGMSRNLHPEVMEILDGESRPNVFNLIVSGATQLGPPSPVANYADVDRYETSRGLASKSQIVTAGSAGQNSGWLLIAPFPERLFYQLDSGSAATTFSIEISADSVTSLGTAFTGSWSSSATGEFSSPISFTNPLAKFFRFNVLTGGTLSVYRNA